MTITSSALDANDKILTQYTCEGPNVSPPLTFSEITPDAHSLTLILEDPDAPGGVFTHWILYDMSPATLQLTERTPPLTGRSGTNDFGSMGYGGPCPPTGSHRYIFKLYALNTTLALPEGATKDEVIRAMDGHILEVAELVGTYAKVG